MTDVEDKWLDRDCWKNKGRLYRYFVLLNLCILGFGMFLTLDTVGSLQELIMEYLELNALQFSYLYSVGSWPTVVLCFFGGFLIDRVFGIKFGTILYTGVVTFGHFIFALGILLSTYWCALIGRLFFGVGIEFINVCLQYYSVIYFKGKELSMVLCLSMAISRLGSSAMYEMAAPLLASVRRIYEGNQDIGIVIFIVGSFLLASLMSSIMLSFMNPRVSQDSQKQQAVDQIKFTDIRKFGLSFWLAVVCGCFNAMNVYLFIPFSQAFFMEEYGVTLEQANSYVSYFSLMGAASSLLTGVLVDNTGREISFVCLGFIIGIISHLIVSLTTVTPFFSMFLLALSFSTLSASVFPLVAYIVPEKMLGTAYGINQSMMNLSFSVLVIIAGTIIDNNGYQSLEFFVVGLDVAGLLAAMFLWLHNYRTEGCLNWTAKQRHDFINNQNQPTNEAAVPLKH